MSYLKRLRDRAKGGSVGFVGSHPQEYIDFRSDTTVHQENKNNDRVIESADALKNHIRTCTDHHPEKFTDSWGNPPTEPTKPSSVGFVGSQSMPWPPRPVELSGWSIDRRQRWGEIAKPARG
jgi:hypothetical protein